MGQDGSIVVHAERDEGLDEKQNWTGRERNVIEEISEELLDVIAPNGEREYALQKIGNMTEEEAMDIIIEAIKDHENDWNFPPDMKPTLERLTQGAKAYGPDYERDLRVNAYLLRYSSPYPEVRSVSDPNDDSSIPIETFRAYFLGIAWAVIGTFVSTFFNSRFPAISLGGSVIQILLFPCAKFLEFVLPDWGFTFRGKRHSLNPGPWTFKEQMFATITYNVAIYTTNTYVMILVQRKFYDDTYVNFGYQIYLTLFVQCMGIGFAGILRRFSVYPVRAIWPSVLPTIAMNRALLKPEKKEVINGWKVSRFKFFYIAFGSMFVYYWIPGYLFTALSSFNWITWIAPHNFNLAAITGSQSGLGFNPWTTFDWNVATSSYQALAQPFFATAQMYIGSIIGGLIIVAIYYTNTYWTAYIPINSSNAFANDGTAYDVTKVVRDNKLINDLYQKYSPPFYSAGYILTLGANFAFYPIFFLYTMINQWPIIKQAYIDFYRGIRQGKGNFENKKDIHCRNIAKYGEVPDWWFLLILVASVILAITFVTHYPIDTPVWLVFLILAISIVFMVPQSVLMATTATNLSLNTLIQVITGYLLPNNPQAFLFASALGGWAIVGYSENYVSDQKMAHYCGIAPRAIFRGQLSSIVITIFVAVATEDWIIRNVPGLCTPDQPSRFTCAGDALPTYANSLMWGLLGSKRVFGALYPSLKWAFLIGFCVALLFLFGQRYGPWVGNRIKAHAMDTLAPRVYSAVDYLIFKPISIFQVTNPVLILQGVQHWAPSNMAYKTPGFYLSVVFMYFIRRRYTAWWEKYNYVLSAALTAGVAFCAVIKYFAVEYNPKPLNWWGNTVSSSGLDGQGIGRLPLPERGYFGPDKGHFP
ncbi:oligopeptide transporter 2 [Trichomonascus vanleenenianus]|uniref:oligopeptide transporter 2 n=1 Tax=Trichomonascus vanleenenianus TaxID=2268995 RepID=UPI003ECA3EE1